MVGIGDRQGPYDGVAQRVGIVGIISHIPSASRLFAIPATHGVNGLNYNTC